MKFIHLSDLHLGKRVNGYYMLEDQQYILTQIMQIIDEEMPDGVILAGDIYDKAVPPADAVSLFDEFLYRLSQRKLHVFIISGNHDSAERIAFGGRLMTARNIHIAPVYQGEVQPIEMQDVYGKLYVWMLPFVKPVHVRSVFPEEEILSYTDAVQTAVSHMDLDISQRNIMITHQFVTGAVRTESEEISVGGTDNVDVSVFSPFDYTALGHLHRAQCCSAPHIRYCGTPLKYSFSEVNDQKSVTIVEFCEKGNISISEKQIDPLREMVEIKGSYQEIMNREFYAGTSYATDYMHIILTDEEDIPDAVGKLRSVYHNLMKLNYDNARTRCDGVVTIVGENHTLSPFEHFSEFFRIQNNRPMTEEQCEMVKNCIEQIWEEIQ